VGLHFLFSDRVFGRSWLVLSAATVKIGSFMCGGMENADRSKEVWPRTERIFLFIEPTQQKKKKIDLDILFTF